MNTATNVLNELLGPVNLQVIISSTLSRPSSPLHFCGNTRLTLRFNLIPVTFRQLRHIELDDRMRFAFS